MYKKCRCGKRIYNSLTLCKECNNNNNLRMNERREYARKGYYCRDCFSRHIDRTIALWYCPICLVKHKKNRMKNYYKNRGKYEKTRKV